MPDRSDEFKRYISGVPSEKDENEIKYHPPSPEEEQKLHSAFEVQLSNLLNRHSAENATGTPDFILAAYLQDCLTAYNKTVIARAAWRNESVELPALQEVRAGKRTVPMIVTSPNGRMMNDIGVAEIKLTPGEQVPIGRIEKVIAIFEEEPDGE